jgi:flagellar protein FlaF
VNPAPFRNTQFQFGAEHMRTDRDNEYMVFSRVIRLLQSALESGNVNDIIRATHANTELWIALASDLASQGNELPDQLKANLISLAIFSIKHGHRVMSEDAPLQPLLDINLHIMKGLRGEVQR